METLEQKTYLPMPEIAENARLVVSTVGSRGKITSHAHIAHIDAYGGETFRAFDDFSCRVLPPIYKSGTVAIQDRHTEALQELEPVKAAALAHYKKD